MAKIKKYLLTASKTERYSVLDLDRMLFYLDNNTFPKKVLVAYTF